MKKWLIILVAVALLVFALAQPSGVLHKEFPAISKKIFKPRNPSVLNFGDVMFDRGVRNIIENRGRDPFEYVKQNNDFFNDFDVVIANLEGPIVEMDRSKCQQKAYNFQFASDTPKRLLDVGINMVNIANNHSYDCYRTGAESTKKYLRDAGIDFVGDSNAEKSFVLKEIDGKKFAFVGIDETVQMTPVSEFYPLIKKLDTENDFVVVDIHWGTEYSLVETGAQEKIAHTLIDNGADVIFGHHPHVIEPVRIYKGKAIFYSLGNFVFDQDFGDTTVGLGAGVEFGEDKTKFTIYPFNIKLFAPDFMTGDEQENFCQKFFDDLEHDGCSFEIINNY
jgi:poly-gamma-glutamate synthesis protein (capsule biosynthesis protein)